MGDYLRLLTVSDREVPLATLQRAASGGAVWSVDHPETPGNYLAIGPETNALQKSWATVEHNPVSPNTLGAEEIAEFVGRLGAGGPPSAVRWLGEYLPRVRAIYAIRISPEAMTEDPDAVDAVFAIRTALRDLVGGIGQWDGQGFTNEHDQLIWCDPADHAEGVTAAAQLDESTCEWVPVEVDLSDPAQLAAFLKGEIPRGAGPG